MNGKATTVLCETEIMSGRGGKRLHEGEKKFGGTEKMECAGIFFTLLH
jgi:hypothetical protein